MAKEIKEEKPKNTFTKASLLTCFKYQNRKDLLNALLEDNKNYTFEEIDKIIEKFMKGEVK